jgi:hypothetical protein
MWELRICCWSFSSLNFMFLSLKIVFCVSHVAQHNAMLHDISGGSTVEWGKKFFRFRKNHFRAPDAFGNLSFLLRLVILFMT